jgi:peptidoglycan/LPS O-acetylase OafA/YrhL
MTYRSDIEGLRALAILLVVAAHAGVPGMQGGFVGVDVFFVISGYLITGLLVTEHARTGRIGIAAFYARRFRRLLPALLLMLLVTALAVHLLLSPEERTYQGAAGAAASFWASNLYFAFERIDYFGLASESNVYLHTWSLGLEEQFYLVWPLLLLLLLPRGTRMQGRWLAAGLGLVLAVSVVACVLGTQMSSRHAFYLMPFRAWQFAAGALAWLLATKRVGFGSDRLATTMGAAGLLLIVLSLVLIRRDAVYPGAWALLPTLGAVGMLLAATTGRNIFTRALALPPLQALGKVSYSWYLWHWPVLVVGAVLLPTPSLVQRILLGAWALLVAVLSYRLLERPIRANDALVREPRRWILMSLLLMLGVGLMFLRWTTAAGAGPRDVAGPAASAVPGVPAIYLMGCDDWYHSDRLFPCVFGDAAAPRTAVVIGDSIGLQWFPAYADIFSSPKWRLVVLTKSSCPMVERPIFNARIGREFTECASWRDKALGYVESLRPDVVVMGTTHTADFDEAAWVEGTGDVLARLAPATGRVFIMRSTPLLPFNGAQCVHRRNPADAEAWHQAATACSAPVADQKNDEVYGWLKKASDRWGNVDVVDMNDDACPGGICSAVHGLELAYRDNQHLDARFVKQLSAALREKMGEAAVGDGREQEAGSEGP